MYNRGEAPAPFCRSKLTDRAAAETHGKEVSCGAHPLSLPLCSFVVPPDNDAVLNVNYYSTFELCFDSCHTTCSSPESNTIYHPRRSLYLRRYTITLLYCVDLLTSSVCRPLATGCELENKCLHHRFLKIRCRWQNCSCLKLVTLGLDTFFNTPI